MYYKTVAYINIINLLNIFILHTQDANNIYMQKYLYYSRISKKSYIIYLKTADYNEENKAMIQIMNYCSLLFDGPLDGFGLRRRRCRFWGAAPFGSAASPGRSLTGRSCKEDSLFLDVPLSPLLRFLERPFPPRFPPRFRRPPSCVGA